MKRIFSVAAIVVLLCLFPIGCDNQAARPDTSGNGSTTPAGTTTAVPDTGTPAAGSAELLPPLSVIDEQGLAELLQAQQGNVVLVDFWATWCVTCLELMPHTAALQKELGEKGLHVVLVSIDSPEDDREQARAALAHGGVTFESFISRYGMSPRSAEAFHIENATLPNIQIYDRKGTLRKVFSEGRIPPEPFTAEDIDRAVRELLAEPASP